jgi:hypothetical protein
VQLGSALTRLYRLLRNPRFDYWLKMSKRLRLKAGFVREHLPPPPLRVFKRLTAPQK